MIVLLDYAAAMGLHPPCGSLDAKIIIFFEIHNTDRSIKMDQHGTHNFV